MTALAALLPEAGRAMAGEDRGIPALLASSPSRLRAVVQACWRRLVPLQPPPTPQVAVAAALETSAMAVSWRRH